MNLTDSLIHHASRFPDRVAIEYEGRSTSWFELLEGTRRTAGALRAARVESGDVVGVLLHNSDRFLELMHAISHVGAVFMPLNWRLASPELEYIIQHAQARLLVSEPELMGLLEPIRTNVGCPVTLIDDLRGGEPVYAPVDADPSDVLRLMYTSGTTSRPKGAMITYANLIAKNTAHIIEFGMTGDSVNLVCGPLYHVGALDLTTSTCIHVGARTHVLGRFDAGGVLDAIERHRATDIWLAPVMINQLVRHADIHRRDLTSVRLIIDGGEKMPLPLIERVLAAFPNAWFADAYGLTETVSGDTILDKGRTLEKLGSVGKPVIHAQVRVVDGDGKDVAAGEHGEVILRGPKVFKGYWRDDETTSRVLREGWLHTGDMGMLDEDGYLFIVDRLKDVIVSGGENIASSEVERVLYEHDAVLEAAVVGRPDPRWFEVPAAYVVLQERAADVTTAELDAHCRARLAGYKCPKVFRVVSELPRNPSGKVLKRLLRDQESTR